MDWRPISADSHITEPPNCYVDNIDPAFRERAPRRSHSPGNQIVEFRPRGVREGVDREAHDVGGRAGDRHGGVVVCGHSARAVGWDESVGRTRRGAYGPQKAELFQRDDGAAAQD